MRLRGLPARPRFGIRDAGNNAGRPVRAGVAGMAVSNDQPIRPARQRRATILAAFTFCCGSAVSRTARAAAAMLVCCR